MYRQREAITKIGQSAAVAAIFALAMYVTYKFMTLMSGM
jgi:hypothetical protein